MTANDLIDKIEKIQNNPLERIDWWVLQFVVPMLRQQQAEIGRLKQIIDANNLNQNIGQFVKPVNEPVAWAYIDELDNICKHGDWQINVTKTKEYSNQIGLFAYPNEDRESDIYSTGYWNGIAECKKQYELYGAVWHDEHGYQFTATVGEKVLNDDRWIKLYRKVEK